MNRRTSSPSRLIVTLGRIILLVGPIGITSGCGDGLERGTVKVPARSSVERRATESATAASKRARKPVADAKVLTLGRMLR
jgi:hypothetical protein